MPTEVSGQQPHAGDSRQDHHQPRWRIRDAAEQSAFAFAEEDLRIRGPGDFTGTRQSGMPLLRAGNLLRDIKLLELSRLEALDLISKDPQLEAAEHAKLKDVLLNTLGDHMNLMQVI